MRVSVRLREIPKDQFAPVRFYSAYGQANRAVLLDGEATREVRLDTGTHDFVVPVSGLLTLEKTK